jgi:hypothetical protein
MVERRNAQIPHAKPKTNHLEWFVATVVVLDGGQTSLVRNRIFLESLTSMLPSHHLLDHVFNEGCSTLVWHIVPVV